jgi:TPR repeat protein
VELPYCLRWWPSRRGLVTQHGTTAIAKSGVQTVQTETQESAGYSWLFEPPKANDHPASFSTGYAGYYESVRIDFGRLVIQWLTVAFLTGVGLLYFKESDKKSLKGWLESLTPAKPSPTSNPPKPIAPSLPISETQVPNQRSKQMKRPWQELGIGLLILCFLVSLPPFRKGLKVILTPARVILKGWEGAASREIPNSSPSPQVGNPNNATDIEVQAAAQFGKDFYEKYPELKPYSRVCEAAASGLQATGYKSQSREAAMKAIAQAASIIVALQQAAEQGDALAQNSLGWMFDTGRGVPKDYEEAFKWYSMAANQGDAEAQNNLGTMYQNGQGVRPDNVEAFRLYCLSATQGNTNAINNRDSLLRSLTHQQIAEGQREAANSSPIPQSVVAAEFRRDFFEKYPDLKPHESVVDAVANRLEASGYKSESRQAVMEKFAEEARVELARQQGASP